MKKNIFILLTVITSMLCSSQIRAIAQNLDFDTTQTLTVSGPGFFPFSTVPNNQFHDQFSTDPNLNVMITNFLGGPCTIAPASDFAEIGDQINLTGSMDLILDFSMSKLNVDLFGLSFVPTGSPCTFDLFITLPQTSSTSSSSSSGGITTGGDDTITPNGFTVFGQFLSDGLTNQLSNESNNQMCGSSPFGIEQLVVNGSGGDDSFIINNVFDELGLSPSMSQRVLSNRAFNSTEPVVFTLATNENKKNANTVYTQKLTNTTDMTKIFVTAIFPSASEVNTVMLGRVSPEIEVTLKEQNNVALAAVQHAIVSATMPWQLSPNGGYFITQGGGCVGPFCTIVEAGMVVIDPDGACTPEKLNKRKAGYPTFNPSKFFDPFPFASMTIQISAQDIVDPKHPLVSKVVRDNAYLIFQPVPPKAKLNQQLKLSIKKKN